MNRDYSLPFLAALGYGFAPVLFKAGLIGNLPPVAGTTIAMFASIPFSWLLLISLKKEWRVHRLDPKSIWLVFGCGAFSAVAFLTYTMALKLGQVSAIAAIANSYPVFNLILVRFFLKKEKLTLDVVLATLFVAGGVYLITS